jgi:hypothetical protein
VKVLTVKALKVSDEQVKRPLFAGPKSAHLMSKSANKMDEKQTSSTTHPPQQVNQPHHQSS